MVPSSDKLWIFLFAFLSCGLLVWIIAVLIQKWLARYEALYVAETSKTLEEMFLFLDTKKLFQLNLSLTIVFFALGYLFFSNIIQASALGAMGFLLPKWMIRRTRRKRLDKFESQLVDCLNIISNALRANMNLVQAFEIVENEMEAPISQEFGLILREFKVGATIEDALVKMTSRVESDDLRLIVTAMNTVNKLGGDLKKILDSMAAVITERHKIELKTKALTSQGRAQSIIVGLLPSIIGGMLFLMDPSLIKPMFTTTLGNIALGMMFFMQIVGYLMIKKITTIEI